MNAKIYSGFEAIGFIAIGMSLGFMIGLAVTL